jgi:hypothetical protein
MACDNALKWRLYHIWFRGKHTLSGAVATWVR